MFFTTLNSASVFSSLLRKLFNQLGATDEQISSALERRGVKLARHLTESDASEIIEKLQDKISAGDDTTKDATSGPTDGPCDEELANSIKSEMRSSLDQSAIQQVLNHLAASGIPRLKYMKRADALTLLNALQMKNIAAFFEQSLEPFIAGDKGDNTPF